MASVPASATSNNPSQQRPNIKDFIAKISRVLCCVGYITSECERFCTSRGGMGLMISSPYLIAAGPITALLARKLQDDEATCACRHKAGICCHPASFGLQRDKRRRNQADTQRAAAKAAAGKPAVRGGSGSRTLCGGIEGCVSSHRKGREPAVPPITLSPVPLPYPSAAMRVSQEENIGTNFEKSAR